MGQKESNREIPDVLGLELSAAEVLLQEKQISAEIQQSKPVPKEPPKGFLRVIRQRSRQNSVILTVCSVPDNFHK